MNQDRSGPPEGTKRPHGAAPNVSSRSARSKSFKYYIHDSVASCRLKLIGDLTEAEVTELSGCWRTAKTILGQRKLILDLRSLRSVDELGKQWLAGMAQEGACYLPDAYLRDMVAGKHSGHDETDLPRVKTGLFGRILNAVSGMRVEAVK